jgi:hypothetical protein
MASIKWTLREGVPKYGANAVSTVLSLNSLFCWHMIFSKNEIQLIFLCLFLLIYSSLFIHNWLLLKL